MDGLVSLCTRRWHIYDASNFTDMIFVGVGFLSIGCSSAFLEFEPSSLPTLLKSHRLLAALFTFPFAKIDPVSLPFRADDQAAGC